MNEGRVSVHVTSKDRHGELYGMLCTLWRQSFRDWDLVLLDDGSGTPITSCHYLMVLLNQFKLEGHKVCIVRNDKSWGVCAARNLCIDKDPFDDAYTCRLDDDIILAPNYLTRLLNGISVGYDVMTGIVPVLGTPEIERDVKYVEQVICKHEFDAQGTLVVRNDDLAYGYLDTVILPCDQFRTNALYRTILHKEGIRYPDNLTTVGFREELWFSFRAILKGHRIGAHTGAKCWHVRAPSGGTRRQDYSQCVALDEETTNKWVREKFEKEGDFLKRYHEGF